MQAPKREQIAGRCIFCGRAGNLSKQHILPDRLKRLIPRESENHVSAPILVERCGDAFAVTQAAAKVRNGHMGTRRLRIVCKPCNEGWMNNAERAAFDIISPLILGENRDLGTADQAAVSLFAGILFSMIDREHVPTSAIGQDERTFIFENHRLPEKWLVFLGRATSEEGWKFRFRHWGCKTASLLDEGLLVFPEEPNLQICTAGFGKLIIHAMSAQDYPPFTNAGVYADTYGVVPVSPRVGDIAWGSLPWLSDADVDIVADDLAAFMFNRIG